MENKIFILEGPDGTGKSTLANKIAESTKGHILHCSWNKKWNIEKYHNDVMTSAKKLQEYQSVVIDRWAPSEWVYGNVFRNKTEYDVFEKVLSLKDNKNIVWIMCKNKNAVLNHIKNKQTREEMFDDMTDVVANFSLFKSDTPELNWITYDYDEVNINDFVKGLL